MLLIILIMVMKVALLLMMTEVVLLVVVGVVEEKEVELLLQVVAVARLWKNPFKSVLFFTLQTSQLHHLYQLELFRQEVNSWRTR